LLSLHVCETSFGLTGSKEWLTRAASRSKPLLCEARGDEDEVLELIMARIYPDHRKSMHATPAFWYIYPVPTQPRPS
jgi:hypothetical protein